MYPRAAIAQSVQRLSMSWTVQGSNPGGGARFSTPDQTDPGAHPASCAMGTGSFQWVKQPGRDVDHPPPSSAEVKGRVELYLYSHLGLRGLFQGEPSLEDFNRQ
jgi:hypothetical protein